MSLDLTYIPPFSNRLREKLIHLMLLVPRDLRGCMEWMYPNSSSSKNIHPLYLYLNCVIVYIQGTGQQKTEINGCAAPEEQYLAIFRHNIEEVAKGTLFGNI